jgi:shikimate kinase
VKLILIGLRGTGKSTVGALLAEHLQWPFLDTDLLVQQRAGRTIREIFESGGEPAFRQAESAIVREVARETQAVIATGGGAVLDAENVRVLRDNGFVVHLSADPSELWRRISQDSASHGTRPRLLNDASSGPEELRKLMRARAAVYAQARDAEVNVEECTPYEVCEKILLLLRTHGKMPSA